MVANSKLERASEDNSAAQNGNPPDPFNVAALRLNTGFDHEIGVKKLLTSVPVRKPHKQEWIWTHPSEEYRNSFGLIELKQTNESFLVVPALAEDLFSELAPVTLYTAMTRQGVLFLWPVKLPPADGRVQLWHESAREAAELAMHQYVRVRANMALGAYEVEIAERKQEEPAWPAVSFGELLRLAFAKTGRLVDRLDHPLIKQLRGQ